MPKGSDINKAIDRATYAFDSKIADRFDWSPTAWNPGATPQVQAPIPGQGLSGMTSQILAQLQGNQQASTQGMLDRMGALGISGANMQSAYGMPSQATQNAIGSSMTGLMGQQMGQAQQARMQNAQMQQQSQQMGLQHNLTMNQMMQNQQNARLSALFGPLLGGFYGAAGNDTNFWKQYGPTIGQIGGAVVGSFGGNPAAGAAAGQQLGSMGG